MITLYNSQCHAQIMISNIAETYVMFKKPSYSISSDGHTENDDGPQTKMATVAVAEQWQRRTVAIRFTGETAERDKKRFPEGRRGAEWQSGSQGEQAQKEVPRQVPRGVGEIRCPGRFAGENRGKK